MVFNRIKEFKWRKPKWNIDVNSKNFCRFKKRKLGFIEIPYSAKAPSFEIACQIVPLFPKKLRFLNIITVIKIYNITKDKKIKF